MGAAAPDKARNMDDFLDIGEKTTNYPKKSRNVDKIKKEVEILKKMMYNEICKKMSKGYLCLKIRIKNYCFVFN